MDAPERTTVRRALNRDARRSIGRALLRNLGIRLAILTSAWAAIVTVMLVLVPGLALLPHLGAAAILVVTLAALTLGTEAAVAAVFANQRPISTIHALVSSPLDARLEGPARATLIDRSDLVPLDVLVDGGTPWLFVWDLYRSRCETSVVAAQRPTPCASGAACFAVSQLDDGSLAVTANRAGLPMAGIVRATAEGGDIDGVLAVHHTVLDFLAGQGLGAAPTGVANVIEAMGASIDALAELGSLAPFVHWDESTESGRHQRMVSIRSMTAPATWEDQLAVPR